MSDCIKLPEFDRCIALDFETFYSKEYGLKKLTTSSYVRDPRFEVIGVGIVEGSKRRWMSRHVFEAFISTVDWSKTAILAHNAAFDLLILNEHFGVRPVLIFDTLSMASALFSGTDVGGSLKKLAEHYGVGEKGTEVLDALGKNLCDFTPEEYAAYGGYCINDCVLTKAIFDRMLPHFSETELLTIDTTIRCFTEPCIELDRELLEKTAIQEEQKKIALLSSVRSNKIEIGSNESFAKLLIEQGAEPPKKISPTTGKEVYAFAKTDPGMKTLLEHENPGVRALAETRLGVKSTILESRIGRMLKLCEDGAKAPIALKYAGAHTQRWSGFDKTNFQNLPRGTDEKPSALRLAMMAPKGWKIIACDSAQIEARGLAWLANEQALLSSFAKNEDLYSQFASKVYGRPVDRKNVKADKEAGHMGKTSILGLGYGMGWGKFASTLLAGPMGAPPIVFTHADAEKMDVSVGSFAKENEKKIKKIVSRLPYEDLVAHCSVAKRTVDLYRSTYTQIKAQWAEGKEIIEMMAQGGSGEFGPDGVFKVEDGAILRPSGLRLHYPQLKWFPRRAKEDEEDDEEDYDGYKYYGGKGKGFTRIYGGLLTENIVQAFCRDIVAEQIARVRCKFGYKVFTTVHDEGGFLVREAEVEEALANILQEFQTPPDWCKGIPLNAEIHAAQRYGECK